MIVMLNGVVRREVSGEMLRSPLLRTLREASYSMTIHTPNQQRPFLFSRRWRKSHLVQD